MKNIVSNLLFVILSVVCVNISVAQVVQEQANKLQLIDGVKLEPSTSTKNLIKLKATKVSSSINSQNAADIPKKKDKAIKPPKVLKYGNKKSSNIIKKEDDE
ncbi:hypothetical protein OAJ65_03610 [Flavobacteriales bacterium]|nr:hypothetical protein [Flavobacteriales bacterium]